MHLSERLEQIAEPQTYKVSRIGQELKRKGRRIVDLSLGEPDFVTPGFICEAANRALYEGYTKYTPVRGLPELIDAVCIKLRKENSLIYTPKEIIISTGAKQSLANLILSLLSPGMEAIIPAPYWPSYASMVQLAGGKVKVIACSQSDNYKLRPETLEAAITDQTRLFIFSSPCNPTGTVYTLTELEALASVFARHPNVIVISDEIYEYINYTGLPHASIANFPIVRDQVVLINGMSKGYAMTGWRIGYAAGPEWLISACERVQAQFTSGPNSIAQYASVTALREGQSSVTHMTRTFQQRRKIIIEAFNNIERITIGSPDGAFYVFPCVKEFIGTSDGISYINSDEDLAAFLLKKAGIATVAGSAFGCTGHLRISYACSTENLIWAVEQISAALETLR